VGNRSVGRARAAAVMIALLALPGCAGQGSPGAPAATPSVTLDSGCSGQSVRATFAHVIQHGGSVIIATGTLTGRSATTTDGPFDQMRLAGIRTLLGPSLPATTIAWLRTVGPVSGANAGSLWATDGRLLALAVPASPPNAPADGPVLTTAPIVNGRVIFSTAGCWLPTGLPSRPFTGKLAEIPGSASYVHAQVDGFQAVPLATVAAVAADAGRNG
jgi:hypothetical protein